MKQRRLQLDSTSRRTPRRLARTCAVGAMAFAIAVSASCSKPSAPSDRDQFHVADTTPDRNPTPSPAGFSVLWRKPCSGPGYSGLAVRDGRLYTMMQDGDSEAVVCWKVADGTESWRFRYAASFVNDQGSGPRSTPVVDGNYLYSVGATGILFCLDARTGTPVWRKDLIDECHGRMPTWGVSFTPWVDDERVYAVAGGDDGHSLVAFDKLTGEIRWRSLDDRPAYSSPVLMSGAGIRQLLVLTAEGLVSVDPDTGRLLWRFPWRTPMDCNVATPICRDNLVFISSGYDRGCALLETIPIKGGGVGVRLVYESRSMRNHFSTSRLVGNDLYGFDDTQLACMEFATGRVRWRRKGFRKGTVAVAGDRLVVLGEFGRFAVARVDSSAFRPVTTGTLPRRRYWTAPLVLQDRILIRNREEIICLRIRGIERAFPPLAVNSAIPRRRQIP